MEVVGKETITRETGYLYCVKKDGYVHAVPMRSNKTGKAKKVGTEQIKKDPGYLYFVGKNGKVARAAMKNVAKKK